MNREKGKEFIAGLFLLIGLALIAGLIILFGEVPDLFKPVYHVTVKFEDASGLLKGSDVYLAGAVIGKVTTDPLYIPDTQEVEVHLKINKNVAIRSDAQYQIGDSGPARRPVRGGCAEEAGEGGDGFQRVCLGWRCD